MLCLSGFELYSRWVPLNSYLTVVRSFTLHSTTNLLKANKAIPALFFMMSSEPQELKPFERSKIHRYARHSHYKYKQTSRAKKDEEEKCQIFASAMYPSYHAGVSPEGGLEVGQTL